VGAEIGDVWNDGGSYYAVLLPFNFNDRLGHGSQAEADNRACMAAEQKINEEYSGLLSGYLNQLLPKFQP
jgi:hypothetical protein